MVGRVLYQEAKHSRMGVCEIAKGSFAKFSGEPWTIKYIFLTVTSSTLSTHNTLLLMSN